jgi:hypothetical protein
MGKYLLLGEKFFEFEHTESLPIKKYIRATQAFKDFDESAFLSTDFNSFHQIIPHLIPNKKMKKSLFYRIQVEGANETESDKKTFYKIKGGDSFSIKFEYYLPNYSEFDENLPEQRTITVSSSNPNIEIIGPNKIVLSKYGTDKFIFQTREIVKSEQITLTFWSEYNEFFAAKSVLSFIVEPKTAKNTFYSFMAAFCLSIGTAGIAMFSKAVEDKKGLFSSLKYSFSKLFVDPSGDVIFSNILYIGILTGIFYLIFWLNTKGYKPDVVKLSLGEKDS